MDTQSSKSQNGANAEAINMTEAPYSVNFLARNASGYELQFTVRAITEDGLVLRMEKLIGRLQSSHHDALQRSGKSQAQPAPAAEKSAPPEKTSDVFADEPDDGLKCPDCGSECYDNRQDRKPGDRRPLIKCKNPECDYRIWPAKPKR